jgi:Holliday junction DNA helicase RuvA
MICSLKGIISDIGENYIDINVHDVGYEVLVSRPLNFTMNNEVSLFTYEVYGEDDHYLVGFPTQVEKEAFTSLISVKGIGPKTALNALKATTPDNLYKAIASNNTAYLKKLPGIGPKAAAQIILDLKGQLAPSDEKGNPKQYDEVRAALKSLGFKSKDIDNVLSTINEPEANNEEILRLALRHLSKGSER